MDDKRKANSSQHLTVDSQHISAERCVDLIDITMPHVKYLDAALAAIVSLSTEEKVQTLADNARISADMVYSELDIFREQIDRPPQPTS
ncbi:hypothetical protein [Chromobacterium piscinae]|uniref:hypothetical protein n=1 Tax=Chromobacterium piscinae TaxID=686831 RepID=UPI00320AE158